MTDKLTGKDLEGSGHGLMEVLPRYLPERVTITKPKPQYPFRGSNTPLPEQRSGLLPLHNLFGKVKDKAISALN
jgi:hypothetical protein